MCRELALCLGYDILSKMQSISEDQEQKISVDYKHLWQNRVIADFNSVNTQLSVAASKLLALAITEAAIAIKSANCGEGTDCQ